MGRAKPGGGRAARLVGAGVPDQLWLAGRIFCLSLAAAQRAHAHRRHVCLRQPGGRHRPGQPAGAGNHHAAHARLGGDHHRRGGADQPGRGVLGAHA
jgi:hypothetical protein